MPVSECVCVQIQLQSNACPNFFFFLYLHAAPLSLSSHLSKSSLLLFCLVAQTLLHGRFTQTVCKGRVHVCLLFLNIFLHSSSLHLTLSPVENQNIKKMKIHFPFSKNSKNQSSYIQIIFSPVSLSFSDIYLVNICLIECKTAAFAPSK